MTERPRAPAVARNREPILDILRHEFADSACVLEIGSGTGEHAVFLGRAMPWLQWQTSDRIENHAGINAWLEHERLPNVSAPLVLDVSGDPDPSGDFDAVFSANTAHIMSIGQVEAMFGLVGRVLHGGGTFCLYGPFRLSGVFTGEGNVRFDASLRRQDPDMGIREIDELDRLARAAGMHRESLHEMPANNHVAVWRLG